MPEPHLLWGIEVDAKSVSVRVAGSSERRLIECLIQIYIYEFSGIEPPCSIHMECGDQDCYPPLRSRRKRPQDLGSYDFTMRAMPHVWALEKEESAKALELLEKALAIDPEYPLALSLAGWCHAQRSVYNWADDIAGSQAMARSLAERAAEMSGDDPVILAVLGGLPD